MTLLRAVRRAGRSDRGVTLMEMVVTVAIFSIVMAVAVGSMVLMMQSSGRSEAVVRTSQETNRAFHWLEGRIRYATYIGAPARDASDDNNWHVTFARTDPSTSQVVCYDLRIDAATAALQQRQTAPPTETTDWQTLAAHVSNGAAEADSPDAPFALTGGAAEADEGAGEGAAAGESGARAIGLTVSLVVVQGEEGRGAESRASISLVAFNSATNEDAVDPCEGVSP